MEGYNQEVQENQEATDKAAEEYYENTAEIAKNDIENAWNDYQEYNQEVEENQEKTEEAIQEYENRLSENHYIIGVGVSGSVSDGVRAETSEAIEVDVNNPDIDRLVTTGGGVGTVAVNGSVFVQGTISNNGIPDMSGDGKNTGFSLGSVSVDVST